MLLREIERPIVIFIDEIDSVLGLNFPLDDFFALIRACYNRREDEPVYRRLTFTLIGVATPSDLIADKTRTPFNIGRAIALRGFQFSEAFPLLDGLRGKVKQPETILRHILAWTDGQPFLTQKLCQLILDAWQEGILNTPPGQEANWVENLVRSRLINRWELHDEPEHLKTILHRLLHNEQKAGRLLELYQRILQPSPVQVEGSWEQIELTLSGLVVREQGYLRVRNRIYEAVFALEWVNQQLAALRPYASNLTAWLDANCSDESRLLKGQALKDAQDWAQGKSLSDLDYRFLAASQKLEQQAIQLSLEAARAKEFQARLVQERKTTNLQRYLLGVISLALVAALGLGSIAFWQYRAAKISEIQAISRVSEALFASAKRLDALVEALRARQQLQNLGVADADADTKAQVDAVLRQAVYGAVEYNCLSGHQEFVYGVAISSDGQLIATASRDKTIKLWSPDGKLLKTLAGHQDWGLDVAFSPNGQILASSSKDGTVKLWRRDGHLIRTLKGHRSGIFDIAFSPDGQHIASAGWDNTIKLWQLNGRLVRTIEANQEVVWGVAFSPDGQIIASAGEDHTVKLWSLEGNLLRTLEGFQGNVYTVVFSPDGKTIASASRDRTIKLWRLDGQLIGMLKGHTADIQGLTFSPDGQVIVSSGIDRTVKLWTRDGRLLTTFRGHQARVNSVAFHPDGQRLASSDGDDLVKLWRSDGRILNTFSLAPQSGKETANTGQEEAETGGIDFSPSGEMIAAGNDATTWVKIWRLDGNLVATLKGHEKGIGRVRFSPDGQLIAVAGWDGTIKLWTLDGTLIRTLKGHQAVVQDVAFSPNGKTLASASYDRTVKLWTVDGKLIRTFTGHDRKVYSVAFSPDGKTIASGSRDRTIKLWKLDGALLATLKAHEANVSDVAFSPDGRMLASSSWDKTAILWDLQKALDLNRLHQIGCDWVRDYLRTNLEVTEQDRHLCDRVPESTWHRN